MSFMFTLESTETTEKEKCELVTNVDKTPRNAMCDSSKSLFHPVLIPTSYTLPASSYIEDDDDDYEEDDADENGDEDNDDEDNDDEKDEDNDGDKKDEDNDGDESVKGSLGNNTTTGPTQSQNSAVSPSTSKTGSEHNECIAAQERDAPAKNEVEERDRNQFGSLEVSYEVFLMYFIHKTAEFKEALAEASGLKRRVTSKKPESIVSGSEESLTDLVSGVYEGGHKIWECCLDLVEYLSISDMDVKGKSILELGCGAGLPGIWGLLRGAEVDFQDFNEDVVHLCTVPNVYLNAEEDNSISARSAFYYGDWAAMGDYFQKEKPLKKYDLILTSETIYNPDSFLVLHNLADSLLSPDGAILVAAKSYYFGVGGSVSDFEDFVRDQDVFQCEEMASVGEGILRVILKLTRLRNKKRLKTA